MPYSAVMKAWYISMKKKHVYVWHKWIGYENVRKSCNNVCL